MDNFLTPDWFEETEPEKEIIYYRLKEFVSNYKNVFQDFLNKYWDATELDFINETIKQYYIYKKNVTLIQDLNGNIFIESEFIGINIIEEIIDKVKSNTINEIYFENCKNIDFSFTAIINYLENRKIEIENSKQTNQTETKYQNQIWFKVGLKFATGEITFDSKENPSQIAKNHFPEHKTKSGNSARPYITSAINFGYSKDKDIFKSKKKLQQIIDYCKENKITINPPFKGKIPTNFYLDY